MSAMNCFLSPPDRLFLPSYLPYCLGAAWPEAISQTACDARGLAAQSHDVI